MALDAVIFQQAEPLGNYTGTGSKELYSLLGSSGNWVYDQGDYFGLQIQDQDQDHHQIISSLDFLGNQTDQNCSPTYGDHSSWSILNNPAETQAAAVDASTITSTMQTTSGASTTTAATTTCSTAAPVRPRRRRIKSRKNQEEIENQRMTHIAVERNRRKQMNEYLSMLRSLMPDSYVQRGDQASIIGGAINFVKELEQQVQFLGAQTELLTKMGTNPDQGGEGSDFVPFSEFFTFPQYSTVISSSSSNSSSINSNNNESSHDDQNIIMTNIDSMQMMGGGEEYSSSVADIEVSLVESHANLKIRSRRRPKQLLKMVSWLNTLRLTVLHLNVTTLHQFVLYSLSVKVEDDCGLSSVDEIATALHQLLGRIQEEALL